MKYTKASESDRTEWTLTEFINLHGKFSLIHDSETGKWYGLFDNKGIYTITCVAKAIRNIPVKDLKDNLDKYSVVVLGTMYCVCQRWEGGDIINAFIEEHTIHKHVTKSRVRDIIDSCKSENIRHEECEGYDDNFFFGVVWEKEKGIVSIAGFGINNDSKYLRFDNVKEWYQVSVTIGNVTIKYPFFILKMFDYSVVVCIKTMQLTVLNCKSLTATDFLSHYDFYNMGKHSVDCNYQEHIWIDNVLYDVYLKPRLSLSSLKLFGKEQLLDISGSIIAVDGRSGVYFFRIWFEREGNYRTEEVKCMLSNRYPNDNPMLFVEGADAPFSIKERRFWIDVEDLKETHRICLEKRMHEDNDPWKEYDLINDALDGDPDAYWNID